MPYQLQQKKSDSDVARLSPEFIAVCVAAFIAGVAATVYFSRQSLCYMASGYFTIWLMAGLGIYVLKAVFNNATMRSGALSRAVPLLSGMLLIAAGTVQFTRWKMMHLLRCRLPFGCAASCPGDETSFRIGCKQGVACCGCCAALMSIQLILGIMNPLVMAAVAIVITVEKLFPRPALTARPAGIGAVIAGIIFIIRWATLNHT